MAPSPAGAALRRVPAPVAAVLGAVFVVAGCGTISSSPPPATPTDFAGITGRLNTAGIKAADWVSGDSGCDNAELRKAAIRFDAHGLDQSAPVTLYLYIFRDRDAFERNRAAIGPCALQFATDPQAFEEIEQSPYVIASPGPWAPEFEAKLRATLEEAAGTGD